MNVTLDVNLSHYLKTGHAMNYFTIQTESQCVFSPLTRTFIKQAC